MADNMTSQCDPVMDTVKEVNWDQLDTLEPSLYLTLAMLCIFSGTGVIGNLLVLYVYIKKKDRLISTFFIIVLAAVDFITCLLIIPWTVYLEYIEHNTSIDSMCKVYQFLLSSNIPFSAFIMVAIALDRYFCICHPFVQAITLTRAKIIATVMGLYAAALGSLVACMFGVRHYIPKFQLHGNYTTEQAASQPSNMSHETSNSNMSHETSNSNMSHETSNSNMSHETSNSNMSHETTNCSYNGVNSSGSYVIYYCTNSNEIFSKSFIKNFGWFHVAQYLLCLIYIMGLYTAIYHKVYSRRKRRLNLSTNQAAPMVNRCTITCSQAPETELTGLHNGDSKKFNSPLTERDTGPKKEKLSGGSHQTDYENNDKQVEKNSPVDDILLNKGHISPIKNAADDEVNQCLLAENEAEIITDEIKGGLTVSEDSIKKHAKAQKTLSDSTRETPHRCSSRRERMRRANIKTAMMLSVVAVVFVLTYAPAFIMICFRIKPEGYLKLAHFLYFANNVANPVIYSFMNTNFRTDLKQIFTKRSK